jgi:hypothetical protein
MANPNPSPATRFKPGQVANPKGRPPGRSFTDRLRKEIEKIAPGNSETWADMLVKVALAKALEGDFAFFKLVADKVDSSAISEAIQELRELIHGDGGSDPEGAGGDEGDGAEPPAG